MLKSTTAAAAGSGTALSMDLLMGRTFTATSGQSEEEAEEADDLGAILSSNASRSANTPRTRYSQRVRALEDDALKIVNQVNMSSFRRQFQAQKGKVDIATFISMMQRALNNNRAKVAAAKASKAHRHSSIASAGSSNSGHSGANNSNSGLGLGTNEESGGATPALPELGKAQDAPVPLDINGPDMIARLIELFREIDLDGDGLIVWDEFTRFIVDKAMRFTGLGVGVNEALKEYQHNHNIDPLTRFRHKGLLDKLVAIPRRNYLAAIEQRSPIITLYDCKTGSVVNALTSPAPPVTMTYVEPLHVLVTANSDTTLVAWNLDDGPLRTRWQVRAKWPAPSTQMSLTWVPSKHLLYSGATTGLIYAWDMEEREQRACLRGHSDIVFDLLSIDHLDLVASASLDTSICLWDAYLGTQRQRLLGHKKGVFSLAYSTSHRLLFSAGFDHEAYVWSPFTSSPVYRLKGHAASMVGVVAVEDRPQVITADATGTLKLWDLRNFRCMQTFTTDHAMGDVDDLRGMTCMVHTMLDHTQPRLVVATKRISFLDQLRVKTDPYTDDLPITCALYNDVCLTIVTAAGRNIKVWDALLGNVRNAFLEVSPADISAMCFDHRKRKIIAGDIQGSVQVYNHQTGALMKSFAKRELVSPTRAVPPGVAELVYVESSRRVLVGYTDSAILVYDETAIQCCPCLLEFDPLQRNQGDLVALAISRAPGSVQVASASGRPGDAIKLWNHETAKCEGALTLQSPSPYAILSMIFLDPLPLFAVCCSDAVIRLWAAWGVRLGKRLCLLEIPNAQSYSFKPSTMTSPISTDHYTIWRDPACAPSSNASSAGTASAASSAASTPKNGGTDASAYHHLLRKKKSHADLASPRGLNQAVPAQCLTWDAEALMLYSGDERGQIRQWDLRPFLAELAKAKLLYQGTSSSLANGGGVQGVGVGMEGAAANGGAASSSERWTTGTLSEMDSAQANEYLSRLVRQGESLAPLVYTIEGHEDAVLSLEVSSEPPGLLSASTDQCAKMWGLDGSIIGTLVQGLPLDIKSPAWDLPLDVASRQSREEGEILAVQESVAERHMRRRRSSAATTRRPRHVALSTNRTTAGFSVGSASATLSPSATQRQRRGPNSARAHGSADSRHAAILSVLDTVRNYNPAGTQAQDQRGAMGGGAGEGMGSMPALLSSSPSTAAVAALDERRCRSLKHGVSFIPSLGAQPRLGTLNNLMPDQDQKEDDDQERGGGGPGGSGASAGGLGGGIQLPPGQPSVPGLASTFKRVAPVSSIMPPSPGRRLSDARHAEVDAKICRLRVKLKEIDRSASEDISPLRGRDAQQQQQQRQSSPARLETPLSTARSRAGSTG